MTTRAFVIALTLVAATVTPGTVAAQAPGGAQKLLRGVCILWFKSGGDGAAVAAATSKFGFKPLYSDGKVVALNAPTALADHGFSQVSFDGEGQPRCTVLVEETAGQDRTAEVTADLDGWAAQREPGWTWTKMAARRGGGSAPSQAWETSTHVMTLTRGADMFSAAGPGGTSITVEIVRKVD